MAHAITSAPAASPAAATAPQAPASCVAAAPAVPSGWPSADAGGAHLQCACRRAPLRCRAPLGGGGGSSSSSSSRSSSNNSSNISSSCDVVGAPSAPAPASAEPRRAARRQERSVPAGAARRRGASRERRAAGGDTRTVRPRQGRRAAPVRAAGGRGVRPVHVGWRWRGGGGRGGRGGSCSGCGGGGSGSGAKRGCSAGVGGKQGRAGRQALKKRDRGSILLLLRLGLAVQSGAAGQGPGCRTGQAFRGPRAPRGAGWDGASGVQVQRTLDTRGLSACGQGVWESGAPEVWHYDKRCATPARGSAAVASFRHHGRAHTSM
jgi:hypothetical protein